MHNAVYRALCEPVDGGNGKMREVLPMIAFMTFRSNLEIPTPSEGEPASLFRADNWLSRVTNSDSIDATLYRL